MRMIEAGAGRARPGAAIDVGVSLRVEARLGERVERGQPLARLHLRKRDEALAARVAECFGVAEQPAPAPPLLHARIA
jgi:thymidine phosphorylase